MTDLEFSRFETCEATQAPAETLSLVYRGHS